MRILTNPLDDSVDFPRLYDYEGAAQLLCMTAVALRNRVQRGEGPVPTVIGRRVYFSLADIAAYIKAHRQPPRPVEAIPAAPVTRRRGRPSVADRVQERALQSANRAEG